MAQKYFESTQVKAFPCSYRGTKDGRAFDPESRLNTEYNFIHSASTASKIDSYIISWTDHELKVIIGGYYFEIIGTSSHPITKDSFKDSDGTIYNLYINVQPETISDSEVDARSTYILKECPEQNNIDFWLDTEGDTTKDEISGTYYFRGLCKAPEDDMWSDDHKTKQYTAKLEVINLDGTEKKSSYLPSVYSGAGDQAIKIGDTNNASGNYSFAEGQNTTASGDYSHTEGKGTKATGKYSHAEGTNENIPENESPEYADLIASGTGSHAEGYGTQACGEHSHTEGHETKTYGHDSHAEGINTITGKDGEDGNNYGLGAHAEGDSTQATGKYSHAEGQSTIASHAASHASGMNTKTGQEGQTVVGKNNIGKETTLFEVGNGTSAKEAERANAFEVANNGDITSANDLNVGGNTISMNVTSGNGPKIIYNSQTKSIEFDFSECD